ncbi:MAG: glycoside hydrolase family 127 protein [Clostridia bacterium]|nr:glycoside hydrolase family 127 protein [Clostridia bacterium]
MASEMLNIRQVKVNDPFWNSRIDLVIDHVIPYQWRVLNDQEEDAEPSHAIRNFEIAAGLAQGEFQGYQFQDSDLAKWIEGASYSLLYRDDPELRKNLRDVIGLIGKAQQPDGYLDTHYIVKKPDKKWQELAHGHELYCAGHMLEAAAAYQLATGDDSLMRIMDRLVDLIRSKFGKGPGQIDAYPGHEEIELALMKAYRLTGKEKYRDLAEYFILNRGSKPGFFNDPRFIELAKADKALDASYYQAHKPAVEQDSAEGHAVRAMYFFTGMSDVAAATGNEALKEALKKLWRSVTERRMYVTGGVGSQGNGERFTIDYDLPNDTCYTETCAAIGLAMWSLRMLALEPRAEYADILEKALYNNVLSGISQDGEHYFYVNPLMLKPDVARFRVDHESVEPSRVKWFPCACCPPNVARTLTGLGQYLYTRSGRRIYQHLYIGNETALGDIRLSCRSSMPWAGEAEITVSAAEPFEMALRVPGYAKDFRTRINGQAAAPNMENGYAVLALRDGDRVEVRFDMPPQVLAANPRVTEDCGRACVVRGPLVYCAEETDNGPLLQDFRLNPAAGIETAQSDLFGGIRTLLVHGTRTADDGDNRLYRPYGEVTRTKADLLLIPYYLWNNRGEGEMTVWMNVKGD